MTQHIWEAVRANDKKAAYRLIVNFEADMNYIYMQDSCNSSLTLAKAMLLQEQTTPPGPGGGDSISISSMAATGTSEAQGLSMEEFEGCTLLHLACETADIWMIKLLLHYGAAEMM